MKKPLLIDTNLLILYCVGDSDRSLIGSHKKLKSYTAEDYDLLTNLIRQHDQIVIPPHVLAETYGLLVQIQPPARQKLASKFAEIVAWVCEHYEPSADAVKRQEYARIGLTDCVNLLIGAKGARILTADFDLYDTALRAGYDAVNFNHERERAGIV